MRLVFFAVCASLWFTGCLATPEGEPVEPAPSVDTASVDTATVDESAAAEHPHVELLLAYEEAFNNEDLDGMLALAHDDIEWIAVAGSEMSTETRGKDELAASMASYFESIDTRATIEGTIVNGRYVSFVERVHFTTQSGEARSQASSGIAEVVDGKLRRLSYYPAQP